MNMTCINVVAVIASFTNRMCASPIAPAATEAAAVEGVAWAPPLSRFTSTPVKEGSILAATSGSTGQTCQP